MQMLHIYDPGYGYDHLEKVEYMFWNFGKNT